MTRTLALLSDPLASLGAALRAAVARARHANATWRERQRLAALDDARLHDLGLTRHEAETEAARPIWDIPAAPRRR